MKTLADRNTVSSRTYYYLLDFNDRDDWKTISRLFNKMKLHELDINEYIILFDYATNQDKAELCRVEKNDLKELEKKLNDINADIDNYFEGDNDEHFGEEYYNNLIKMKTEIEKKINETE